MHIPWNIIKPERNTEQKMEENERELSKTCDSVLQSFQEILNSIKEEKNENNA